jgi:hypothetical protein
MDYTKIVLTGDRKGRVNISALDANDCGHGYRLAGPKYINDRVAGVVTPTTFDVELGAEEVDELHSYLRIWDVINLPDQPPEWRALIEASDRYRRALGVVARVRTYDDVPQGRIVELEGLADQARDSVGKAAAEMVAALGYRAGES